jgi:hypothetical protein
MKSAAECLRFEKESFDDLMLCTRCGPVSTSQVRRLRGVKLKASFESSKMLLVFKAPAS